MLRRNFIFINIFVAFITIFISVILFGSTFNNKIDIVESTELNISIEGGFISAPIIIAKQKGFFESNGLNVNIYKYNNCSAGFYEMLDGDIDISIVSSIPIVQESDKRNDFSILSSFAFSDKYLKMIALKSRGIYNPSDLKGKNIGVVNCPPCTFFLDTFLLYNDLDLSDINLIEKQDVSKLLQDLEIQKIDATVLWEPYAYLLHNSFRPNTIEFPAEGEIYREIFNFSVRTNFAIENHDTVVKFLKAIDQANKFINSQTTISQQIVSDELEVDIDIIKKYWDDYTFDLSIDKSLITALETRDRWILKNKDDKKILKNYINYIYPYALMDLDRKAVTIID